MIHQGIESPQFSGILSMQGTVPWNVNMNDIPDEERPSTKWYHKVPERVEEAGELILRAVAPFGQFARRVVAFVDTLTRVPATVTRVFAATKVTSFISAFFHVRELCGHIKRAITESSPVKKARAIFESILGTTRVLMDAAGIAEALAAVGAVSAKAVAWTGTVVAALYPFALISYAMAIERFIKSIDLFSQSKEVFDIDPKKGAAEQQALGITAEEWQALKLKHFFAQYLVNYEVEELHDHFFYAHTVQIDERFENLIQKLQSDNREERASGVKEGLAIYKKLRNRINCKFASEVMEFGMLTSTVVALSTVVLGSPHPAVPGAFFLTASVIGLTKLAFDYIALEGNPFDDAERILPVRIFKWIQNRCSRKPAAGQAEPAKQQIPVPAAPSPEKLQSVTFPTCVSQLRCFEARPLQDATSMIAVA